MTRAIPTTDSSDAVDTTFLIPTFEPGDSPGTTDPVPQSVADIVRSIFTATLEAQIGNSITREQAIDAVGGILANLGEFTYNASTDTFTFALSANSVTAAQARANSAAHWQEWAVRLGIPQVWNTIAQGTTIRVGKIVTHGSAWFACQVEHARSGTGPDGDATNWLQISNWRGTWTAAWYPEGSFVRHADLPWVATEQVRSSDPAPNASTNTKWLQLGAPQTAVVIASSNTAIPSSGRGNTYVHTGSSNITYTLPAASGGSAVPNGWEIVISNQGAGDLTIDGAGSDTIDGEATLVITTNGRSVRLQKIANTAWVTIADTAVGGGTSFTPSKSNLYDAVKAILVHNTAVTADDANDELDITTTAAGAIADNSIAPIKAQAGTAAHQKAWRDRLDSSHIGLVANALPAIANHNTGDTLIIGRGGATVVPFREIDAPADELTATVAGDVMMLLAAGWTRLGNLFTGGPAVAAKQDRLTQTQLVDLLQFDVVPGVIVGYTTTGQATDWLTDWRVWVSGGDTVGDVWMEMQAEGQALLAAPAPTAPGASLNRHKLTATNIYNYTLSNPQRDNLISSRSLRRQGRDIEIDLRFYDAASGGNVIDIKTVAVDWLASPGDLRSLASQIATPASGDRFFFTDENQAGDPLRYAQMAAILNRTFAAKAATAGATRTWTYTLDAADTEILIDVTVTKDGSTGRYRTTLPRALLTSSAQIFVIDSRNPGDNPGTDNKNAAVRASISGNTLTLANNGFANSTAPVVYSK